MAVNFATFVSFHKQYFNWDVPLRSYLFVERGWPKHLQLVRSDKLRFERTCKFGVKTHISRSISRYVHWYCAGGFSGHVVLLKNERKRGYFSKTWLVLPFVRISSIWRRIRCSSGTKQRLVIVPPDHTCIVVHRARYLLAVFQFALSNRFCHEKRWYLKKRRFLRESFLDTCWLHIFGTCVFSKLNTPI